MTKKYWADWQKRINETKTIHLFFTCKDRKGVERKNVKCSTPWYTSKGDRLLRATFHGDIVKLVVEIHETIWSKGHCYQHVENRYLKYHRTEIARIDFYGFE